MIKRLFYRFQFYFTKWFYIIGGGIVVAFILAFFNAALHEVGIIAMICLSIMVVIDWLIVFMEKNAVSAIRKCPNRFSNGDENKISIELTNHRSYNVNVIVIDELPFQFQIRNNNISATIRALETKTFEYFLKPVERGEYHFGIINLFLQGPLNMVVRHIRSGNEKLVSVYPSILQMKRFQLMAISNQLQEAGTRRLRKIGQSLEFEQIKEYVPGDDYRNINWKATARRPGIMVNNFMDERSQQVICLIDKGRNMKAPFNGMALLDYAINTTLALSNIILLKQDKSGLVTFGKKIDQVIQPDKKPTQISLILEALYKQKTDYLDSDFEALYSTIRYRLKQRSLLILFTNFESLYSLERQLPYLKKLSSHHALMVVFFENTELTELLAQKANTLEEVYVKAIATKFAFEKKQIVKELQKHGIMSLLTPPEKLTINTINKYLEIKARRVL
jgi:uncharacterized protein (DUF58 family)